MISLNVSSATEVVSPMLSQPPTSKYWDRSVQAF